jgi:hypothetical protein
MAVTNMMSGLWPVLWIAIALGMVLTVVVTWLLAVVTDPRRHAHRSGSRPLDGTHEQLPESGPEASLSEHEPAGRDQALV